MTFPAGLTQREVDVLRLLAQRQTDKEIADALFMSYRTGVVIRRGSTE